MAGRPGLLGLDSGEDRILLGTMSTPDHVEAMQRCKGVLCSEGGPACHAAIIARGMRVPTILNLGSDFGSLIVDRELLSVTANFTTGEVILTYK